METPVVFSDATHGGESPAGEKSPPEGQPGPKPPTRVAAVGVTAEEMADLAGGEPARTDETDVRADDRTATRREGTGRRSFWSFGG